MGQSEIEPSSRPPVVFFPERHNHGAVALGFEVAMPGMNQVAVWYDDEGREIILMQDQEQSDPVLIVLHPAQVALVCTWLHEAVAEAKRKGKTEVDGDV